MIRAIFSLSVALSIVASTNAAVISTPGLTTVRFWEYTGGPNVNNFAFNGSAMTTQLGVGILSPLNRDFDGLANENYDVFYSDANGAFNVNGNYVTVEAIYPNANGGGGLNLAAVDLIGSFGTMRADVLTSWVGLGPNYIAGSEVLSVDVDSPLPATFTTMGSTIVPPPQHLRVTVGWTQIPEPGTACMVGVAALASLGIVRGRRPRRSMR